MHKLLPYILLSKPLLWIHTRTHKVRLEPRLRGVDISSKSSPMCRCTCNIPGIVIPRLSLAQANTEGLEVAVEALAAHNYNPTVIRG